MDNKKFDEVMHKYVAGKTRGMDADFTKLNEQNNKKIAGRYKSRLIWATMSCVAVIAIVLSIVLPLTLHSPQKQEIGEGNQEESGGDNQSQTIQYFEEEDISFVIVESKEDIPLKYNITALLPTIQYLDVMYSIVQSKSNDTIVGAYIELGVYDEYFDGVEMYIISENNDLALLGYKTLLYESIWRNITVKYSVKTNEYTGCNFIKIFFESEGYKYYVDAEYYEDFNVEEVLDLIF